MTTQQIGAVLVGAILISVVLGVILGLLLYRLRRRRARLRRRSYRGLLQRQTGDVISRARGDAQLAEQLARDPMRTLRELGAAGRSVRYRIRLNRGLGLPSNATAQKARQALAPARPGPNISAR